MQLYGPAIRIVYETDDRFAPMGPAGNDPHLTGAQIIRGVIQTFTVDEDSDEISTVNLGTIELGLLDLIEVGEPSTFFETLDSHSGEWLSYMIPVQDMQAADSECVKLLICHRVNIVPAYRGQGLGLHALARAILTWGSEAAVFLTAESTEDSHEGSSDSLVAYWSRLGFTEVANAWHSRMMSLDMTRLYSGELLREIARTEPPGNDSV